MLEVCSLPTSMMVFKTRNLWEMGVLNISKNFLLNIIYSKLVLQESKYSSLFYL